MSYGSRNSTLWRQLDYVRYLDGLLVGRDLSDASNVFRKTNFPFTMNVSVEATFSLCTTYRDDNRKIYVSDLDPDMIHD